MSNPTRTRLSPEKRKAQLLDTAVGLLLEKGLQNFTIEALARAAGVTVPLVYNYFSGRVELLQALLRREHEHYVAHVSHQVIEAKSFEDVVRVFIRSNFDYYAKNNVLPILQSQPEISIAIKDELKSAKRNSARFIVDATAESLRLNINQAELVTSMSSGASIAAAQFAARGRNQEETVELVLRYILAGMAEIANLDS